MIGFISTGSLPGIPIRPVLLWLSGNTQADIKILGRLQTTKLCVKGRLTKREWGYLEGGGARDGTGS